MKSEVGTRILYILYLIFMYLFYLFFIFVWLPISQEILGSVQNIIYLFDYTHVYYSKIYILYNYSIL